MCIGVHLLTALIDIHTIHQQGDESKRPVHRDFLYYLPTQDLISILALNNLLGDRATLPVLFDFMDDLGERRAIGNDVHTPDIAFVANRTKFMLFRLTKVVRNLNNCDFKTGSIVRSAPPSTPPSSSPWSHCVASGDVHAAGCTSSSHGSTWRRYTGEI